MSDFKKLLQGRRRRAIADVMGTFERSTGWGTMPDVERKHVRAAVYGAVNGYHDVALDMLAVYEDDDTVKIDQRVVGMIEDLHNDLLLDSDGA